MNTVDEYIATVTLGQRDEFERIARFVVTLIPQVVQGKSYGMAAFMYEGKPLVSFVANKKFLSLYPFSGKVIDKLRDRLSDFETTSGSIHFSEANPLPDDILKAIITTRRQEIDERRGA